MSNQEYIDPILKKYVDLIKISTDNFKRFYYGDPVRIATSEMPVLIINKIDTRVSAMTNVEDKHQVRISITVVTDVRETISDDHQLTPGINALYNLMEGRQDSTYQLNTDSLLYILRHNVELDPGKNLRTDLGGMTTINYGMAMNKRKPESWSIEGTIDFTATFIQVR